jgi:hypothetical protein
MRPPIDLYELLPAVYRLRDSERGEPLRALLDIVSDQAELLRDDLDGLWDDLFVETAAEWVVPYIGDLVANTPLYEVPLVGRRADVAKTLHWRRRKGTLAMLGELARGITGWGVHAVAMFELLGVNQNLNHLRMEDSPEARPGLHPFAQDRVASVDIRARDAVDRIGGAFETITHNVDVRRIADDEGWYGIRKVCFFFHRLTSFPLKRTTPARAPGQQARCLHVHPLGQDAPLFHRGERVPDDAFATEVNVDAPIRPYRFFEQPGLDYGPGLSLHIVIGTTPVPLADVLCKDLDAWPAVPVNKVGVDVRRGRVRIGTGVSLAGGVRFDSCYGFSAPLGGGPYAREPRPPGQPPPAVQTVAADGSAGFTTIEAAVAAWNAQPNQGPLYIEINDSATYRPAGGAVALDWTGGGAVAPIAVTLVAADRQRPVIVADLTLATTQVDQLTLDGLALAGQLSVAGPVRRVAIIDSTLVPGSTLNEDGTAAQPGRASLVADAPGDRRDVTLTRTITGRLRLAPDDNHVALADCAVDAPAGAAPRVALSGDDAGAVAGPPVRMERCTVLGAVFARELTLMSESIVAAGPLIVERRQTGCVRFSSYEREGSSPPRRYRCQPDLVREAAPDPATADRETLRVRPSFTTTHYGRPAYLQLSRACAREIEQGAEDRAEMGVFHLLLQPYRETNLGVRLEEYLPFGLEPGIVHIT